MYIRHQVNNILILVYTAEYKLSKSERHFYSIYKFWGLRRIHNSLKCEVLIRILGITNYCLSTKFRYNVKLKLNIHGIKQIEREREKGTKQHFLFTEEM